MTNHSADEMRSVQTRSDKAMLNCYRNAYNRMHDADVWWWSCCCTCCRYGLCVYSKHAHTHKQAYMVDGLVSE